MILPKHLAIIMDGNGRWAKARGHNRYFGHIRGARIAKQIIEECSRLGVSYLTLFTFSTENWLRPEDEVSFLMHLLMRRLRRERAQLIENNIRFRVIGDTSKLPANVRHEVELTILETANNTGMTLVFALSYGGRQEITRMVKTVAQKILDGKMSLEQISDNSVAETLESAFMPDPDLIVRTSGESRISNFFLWQAAYSEIFIEPLPWPEFSVEALRKVLAVFGSRERRFGRTSEQLISTTTTSAWNHSTP